MFKILNSADEAPPGTRTPGTSKYLPLLEQLAGTNQWHQIGGGTAKANSVRQTLRTVGIKYGFDVQTAVRGDNGDELWVKVVADSAEAKAAADKAPAPKATSQSAPSRSKAKAAKLAAVPDEDESDEGENEGETDTAPKTRTRQRTRS